MQKYTVLYMHQLFHLFLGAPLIVVGITMGINKLDNYRTKTDLYVQLFTCIHLS